MRLLEDVKAWLDCSKPAPAYITLSPEAYWTALRESLDEWKRQTLFARLTYLPLEQSEYGTLRKMTRRGDNTHAVYLYGVPVYLGVEDQDAPIVLHPARDPLIFGASA